MMLRTSSDLFRDDDDDDDDDDENGRHAN